MLLVLMMMRGRRKLFRSIINGKRNERSSIWIHGVYQGPLISIHLMKRSLIVETETEIGCNAGIARHHRYHNGVGMIAIVELLTIGWRLRVVMIMLVVEWILV